MKRPILIIAVLALVLTSCKILKPCDPENIRSGRSAQYHDSKKMRAAIKPPHQETIRVMWIHRDGPVYHVRFANMKKIESRVYFKQLPSAMIKEGHWVPVDSLCEWDNRAANI